jgi:hypothetical protein
MLLRVRPVWLATRGRPARTANSDTCQLALSALPVIASLVTVSAVLVLPSVLIATWAHCFPPRGMRVRSVVSSWLGARNVAACPYAHDVRMGSIMTGLIVVACFAIAV